MTERNIGIIPGGASPNIDVLGAAPMAERLSALYQDRSENATHVVFEALGNLAVENVTDLPTINRPGVAARALEYNAMHVRVARSKLVDPLRYAPQTAHNMIEYASISERVDGAPPVPVGSLSTYLSPVLPLDEWHTMTGLPEERGFRGELNPAYLTLYEAALSLSGISLDDLKNTEIVVNALSESASAADAMRSAMVNTARIFKGQPEGFFAGNIRSVFDPIPVGGIEYDAPGAAQMPWQVLERMLHAYDSGSVGLERFYDKNESYLPLPLVMAGKRFISENGQSIFDYARTLVPGEHLSRADRRILLERRKAILIGFIAVQDRVKRFNNLHTKFALDDFDHRPQGATGGAGYRPDELEEFQQGRRDILGESQAILEETQRMLDQAA